MDMLLSLNNEAISTEPIFAAFYREPSPAQVSLEGKDIEGGLCPPIIPHLPLPESPDAAAAAAEAVFRTAVKQLRGDSQEETDGAELEFWPPVENQDEEEDEL